MVSSVTAAGILSNDKGADLILSPSSVPSIESKAAAADDGVLAPPFFLSEDKELMDSYDFTYNFICKCYIESFIKSVKCKLIDKRTLSVIEGVPCDDE